MTEPDWTEQQHRLIRAAVADTLTGAKVRDALPEAHEAIEGEASRVTIDGHTYVGFGFGRIPKP